MASLEVNLRPHERPDCAVLEAALRSFPPFTPTVLRWAYPTWTVADDLGATHLQRPKTSREVVQEERDNSGMEIIRRALETGPKTHRKLRETGMGPDRLDRLLKKLQERKEITKEDGLFSRVV